MRADREDRQTSSDEGGGTEKSHRRGGIMLVSVAVLLSVFAGLILTAYFYGQRQPGPDGTPPVILADRTPYKSKPDDAGGMEIPHQDKRIFELGRGEDTETVERLLPRAEEPVDLNGGAAGQDSESGSSQWVEQKPVTAPQPVEPSKPETVSQPKPQPEPQLQPAAQPNAGSYVVQLAAVTEQEEARSAFARLKAKYPELNGLQPDIQRADLGAKGVFYRIRAGFLSEAQADDLCEKLKAKGQGCLVRPR